MSDRKRLLFKSIVRMTVMMLLAAVVTISAFYLYTVNTQRARLGDIVQNQARLFDALARDKIALEQTTPHLDALTEMLATLDTAFPTFEGFGDTTEFSIVGRADNRIVFLLNRRHGASGVPMP